MNLTNLQNNLLEALGNHSDLIMDLGDNVLLHLKWNNGKKLYEDEMGVTTMKLLLEIARGEVKIQNKTVKLYVDEIDQTC